MNVETVVHHMSVADKPATLEDFLSLAGLDKDRALRKEVGRKIAADLAIGKPLADLAGTKVLRDQGRKKPESWAKDRDIAAMAPRVPKDVKGFLYAPLTRLIELSERYPQGSPRRLSEDVIDALLVCRELDVAEADVGAILALVKALIADSRENAALREAYGSVMEAAQTNNQLVQRLLRHDPEAANSDATGATAVH